MGHQGSPRSLRHILSDSARNRQKQDYVEYGAGRRDVAQLAASYLAQIEAGVVPIVEALKTKHRAARAFDKYHRGLPEARQRDVTEEVIRELDRADFEISFAAAAPAPKP